MSRFRYIAPAGTAIKTSELFLFLLSIIRKKDKRVNLCNSIKEKYCIKHCFLMSSGRAAMAMIFKLLKAENTDTKRNEIIIPSYTCYSVAAAADIAGLMVRVCDIEPQTLSYDKEQFNTIDFSKVLCIVTGNLYGFPNDLTYLESIAKEHGCYLLDDSAQSMNAMIDHRYAGTFGDIGLYSLDKGKNITSLQGGIIVTNNDKLANKINNKIDSLSTPSASQSYLDVIKLLIYSVLIHPVLYWIPARISFLGLGKTIYTTDYIYTQYSSALSNMSYMLFERIDEITDKRKENNKKILKILNKLKYVKHISPVNETTKPGYLRTVIYVSNKNIKKNIIDSLNKNGIGATCSYPESLATLKDIDNFRIIHNNTCTGGKYIADHIITLPNISFLSNNDIKIIKDIFDNYIDYED